MRTLPWLDALAAGPSGLGCMKFDSPLTPVVRCAATMFWSARPEPRLPVEQLSGDVQVTGMPRGLLDHVQDNPAHVFRLHLRIAVLAARCRRQRGYRQHLIRASALFTVETDDLRGGLIGDECRRRVIWGLVIISRRRLGDLACHDPLEPVPFGATEVLDQPGRRPA